jgi:hypothetical protein
MSQRLQISKLFFFKVFPLQMCVNENVKFYVKFVREDNKILVDTVF